MCGLKYPHMDRKRGLAVKNVKLTTASGYGLYQMSNLLFRMFPHTPLSRASTSSIAFRKVIVKSYIS